MGQGRAGVSATVFFKTAARPSAVPLCCPSWTNARTHLCFHHVRGSRHRDADRIRLSTDVLRRGSAGRAAAGELPARCESLRLSSYTTALTMTAAECRV
jgi:hypothetical protein